MTRVTVEIIAILAILFALLIRAELAAGERIESALPSFVLPFHYSMPAGTTVFFQGVEFHGDVEFYRGAGDTVRVSGNGVDIAAWPRPIPSLKPVSLDALKSLYGDVPFVRERVDIDTEERWRAATADYREIQDTVRAELSRAYWAVLDNDSTDFRGALDSAVKRLEPFYPLLDENAGRFVRTSYDLRLFWKGRRPSAELYFLHTGRFAGGVRDRTERIPDPERAERLLSVFFGYAEKGAGDDVLLVYNSRGLHVLSGSRAEAALAQIESAGGGGDRNGPLLERELDEIVAGRLSAEEGE